jgi:hypothetical protein
MTVESFPEFTAPAAKLWATIPAEAKKLLLANVYVKPASPFREKFQVSIGASSRVPLKLSWDGE